MEYCEYIVEPINKRERIWEERKRNGRVWNTMELSGWKQSDRPGYFELKCVAFRILDKRDSIRDAKM